VIPGSLSAGHSRPFRQAWPTRYWDFDMLSWLIEPEPLSWDMVSLLIVSCFMPEPFDIVEFPVLS
jgi:hypothetical protein